MLGIDNFVHKQTNIPKEAIEFFVSGVSKKKPGLPKI